MVWWQACLWGLGGAALVEIRQMWHLWHQTHSWPWVDEQEQTKVAGYAIAVTLRLIMAVGVNAVYVASHQIAGPFAAFTIGVSAPVILQQIMVQAPNEPVSSSPSASPVPPPSPDGRRTAPQDTAQPGDVDVR
ncbi:hypothetical protein ACFZA1_02375 [Streptomyces filipinensis]|uniref:hypothetical protein n=1 Tax=Streptomyces filipinensis TaxID=66887 RepID=UPI0036E31A87